MTDHASFPTETGAGDFAQAIRLLHVVQAWTWTPAPEPTSARADPLYPARGTGSNRTPLHRAIETLLKKYPYGFSGEPAAEPSRETKDMLPDTLEMAMWKLQRSTQPALAPLYGFSPSEATILLRTIDALRFSAEPNCQCGQKACPQCGEDPSAYLGAPSSPTKGGSES